MTSRLASCPIGKSSRAVTRVELSSPVVTMLSGTPPEDLPEVLEEVSLFSKICPWWLARFVSYFHYRFAYKQIMNIPLY